MDLRSLSKPAKELTTKLSEILNGRLNFQGVPLDILIEPSPFGFGRVLLQNRNLLVKTPAMVPAGEKSDFCRNQIINWLKAQARSVLNAEVHAMSGRYGFKVNNIAIKDTRSRWGSCSVKTNLNFNWRLIMTPPDVLRYVVIHETAHLEEMNHSQRFWALVEKRCPDYQTQRNWLKNHGLAILQWELKI